MADYEVRTLQPGDFDALMSLEQSLFGDAREKTLGPVYVRLCCDFFGHREHASPQSSRGAPPLRGTGARRAQGTIRSLTA